MTIDTERNTSFHRILTSGDEPVNMEALTVQLKMVRIVNSALGTAVAISLSDGSLNFKNVHEPSSSWEASHIPARSKYCSRANVMTAFRVRRSFLEHAFSVAFNRGDISKLNEIVTPVSRARPFSRSVSGSFFGFSRRAMRTIVTPQPCKSKTLLPL